MLEYLKSRYKSKQCQIKRGREVHHVYVKWLAHCPCGHQCDIYCTRVLLMWTYQFLVILDHWLPPAQVCQKTSLFQQYLHECWLLITHGRRGPSQQWGPALFSHTWRLHVPLPRHHHVLVAAEQCNVQTCPETLQPAATTQYIYISRHGSNLSNVDWIYNYYLFTVAAHEQSWLKTDERIIVKHNCCWWSI